MNSFDQMIERYKKELIDAKRRSIIEEINNVVAENSENQMKEYEVEKEENPIIENDGFSEDIPSVQDDDRISFEIGEQNEPADEIFSNDENSTNEEIGMGDDTLPDIPFDTDDSIDMSQENDGLNDIVDEISDFTANGDDIDSEIIGYSDMNGINGRNNSTDRSDGRNMIGYDFGNDRNNNGYQFENEIRYNGRQTDNRMDEAVEDLIREGLPRIDYPESTGTLKIQVFAADQVYPISSARVRVTKSGDSRVLFDGYTDSSGIVDNIVLPAPSNIYSLEPSLTRPYALYDLIVERPGFVRHRFLKIPVFSGIESIQNVQLFPSTNGRSDETITTEERPEELFREGE